MGQSPSTILASHSLSHDTTDSAKERRTQARETLSTLDLLSDLKKDAFFGDVHYESSIEGDVLLPLDKVVKKGSVTYCDVEPNPKAVGAEIEREVGMTLRGEVIEALKTTISTALASVLHEASSSCERNWAERRGFTVAVGHLGGIYRLNYLLFTTTTHNYLLAAWALSSVRVNWLSTNAINIALEQGFLHDDNEGHEEFRKRIGGVKDAVLDAWEESLGREARVERRRRSGRDRERSEGKSGAHHHRDEKEEAKPERNADGRNADREEDIGEREAAHEVVKEESSKGEMKEKDIAEDALRDAPVEDDLEKGAASEAAFEQDAGKSNGTKEDAVSGSSVQEGLSKGASQEVVVNEGAAAKENGVI